MEAIRKKGSYPFLHGEVLQKYGAGIALIVLLVVNCFITENFISINTVWNLLTQSTTVMILALGMMVVISTGGIDISVGSMMALASMVTAQFLLGGQIAFGVLAGLLVAALGGFVMGIIVTKFRVEPMITSLSMMFVYRGIAKLMSGGTVLNYKNLIYSDFFYTLVFGVIPIRVFFIVIMSVILWVVLRKTRFGVYVEAYGDNRKATKIAGVDTVKIVTFCYMICSVFAGISGLVEAGITTSTNPAIMGLTKEMDAIAAVVVGGTSISGGRPNIWGTVCGALILQLITMMVNMNNVPYAYARVLKALIIIVAVYLQIVNRNKK